MEAVVYIDVPTTLSLCVLVPSGTPNLDSLPLALASVPLILILIIGLNSYYSSLFTQRTLVGATEFLLSNAFRVFGPHFR